MIVNSLEYQKRDGGKIPWKKKQQKRKGEETAADKK